MFVGVLPRKVYWRDPSLVITIPMIMTALKSSGLFQFSLLTVIAITFKFSLQTLFTMPEQRETLYVVFYSNYALLNFCDIYFFLFDDQTTLASPSLLQKTKQDYGKDLVVLRQHGQYCWQKCISCHQVGGDHVQTDHVWYSPAREDCNYKTSDKYSHSLSVQSVLSRAHICIL